MILEAYNALSDAKKYTLRRKYIYLFGSKATFYKKINGQTHLRGAEQLFFENNLLNNVKTIENK